MVASIGAIASASQGVSITSGTGITPRTIRHTRKPAPGRARGRGALNLAGPVEPELFKKILEGHVPDGTGHRLGRRQKDGTVLHRPGRDITLSAPKSVSLAALIGGDRRIVTAHDKPFNAHSRGWKKTSWKPG